MVRARDAGHLRKLQIRFPSMASAEIRHSPVWDYAYRIIVPKQIWIAALIEMAEEQDWSNFKNKVAVQQGMIDGLEYSRALHDVWRIVNRLQTRRPKLKMGSGTKLPPSY